MTTGNINNNNGDDGDVPKFNPDRSSELYAGYAVVQNTGQVASESGFTYNLTNGNNNIFAYKGSISAASPTDGRPEHDRHFRGRCRLNHGEPSANHGHWGCT